MVEIAIVLLTLSILSLFPVLAMVKEAMEQEEQER